MRSTRLYQVDPEGGVTVPPQSPATAAAKRAAVVRPNSPVPTDRMKLPQSIDALRAFATLSKGGQEPVTTAMVGNNIHLAVTTAGLNNNFFKSVGLITQAGKGSYKPTAVTMEFARKYSFDKETAPKILAPAFSDTWFYDAVKQKLELIPDSTVDHVVEMLAGVAGTDSTYEVQYTRLLEWLEYVGLITTDGGFVKMTEASPAETVRQSDVSAVDSMTSPANPESTEPTTQGGAPPLVSLSIEISVTAEDLVRLTSEQITALFDGIGKVASVKAALQN
jgi:hypothetical protein